MMCTWQKRNISKIICWRASAGNVLRMKKKSTEYNSNVNATPAHCDSFERGCNWLFLIAVLKEKVWRKQDDI